MPHIALASHVPNHRALSVRTFSEIEPRQRSRIVHPHATIAYYISGTAEVWCRGRYRLEKGDVLIVPEGMPHYTCSASAIGVAVVSLCVPCISRASAGGLLELFDGVSSGGPAVWTVAPQSRPKLQALLEAFESELAEETAWQDLAVGGYLALITTILLRSRRSLDAAKAAQRQTDGGNISAKALAFVSRKATTGISLVDVARHVHRSPAHTATVIKAETGRTVVAWITDARLAAARQLLLRSDASIEEVGWRVGFASSSHFHRLFKRHHQATPAQWRKAHERKPNRVARAAIMQERQPMP